MKHIKSVLHFLLGGLYASSWWIAVYFPNRYDNPELLALWVIPTVFTLIMIMLVGNWLYENWEKFDQNNKL